MGVPKFFRYISERYPCLSEFVREYQIPVFDNLYLDMNGIIHMCSHPDDNNPHFRITEEKIFTDVFHYIEVLFSMIKPQKVFFMAVDGVAPRAKMNQQRGRRFRSAKEAEKLEKEAMRKGEKLPDAERFDSNCITPGTPFMARLHEQLKYFVVKKISTDKTWKKCKVILSGQETPGEGEHKIMDYIRYIRSQPGYDPNTRHCLYGLDADLIMLGLCTHDPHFSLLREEVKFGRKAKRSNVPEEIRFYLLHLSLMREYLEMEFSSLKEVLKNSDQLKFDIEKIIDDWILMGFLVGNDFIPNLPNLHIANGALPLLYKAYMEVLPTLDGYINESGTLNLERFEKFMKKLGDIDVKNFEEVQDDLLYMEMKTGRKQTFHTAVHTKPHADDDNDTTDGQEFKKDSALAALIAATDALDVSSEDESDQMSSTTEDEAFKCFKDEYYRNKLEFQKVTPEVMRDQAEGYVRAIQWNLNYYYNGVCSWSWFYPHHYSPYISDIKGFSNLKIDFELGQPFKPYEQLLAVLPTASKNLLPECYHDLMTNDNSIIKSYYPEEFQTDLNGKRQEWEAVVLVPFIDENTLLDAMKSRNVLLSPEEAKRNQHGPMLIYEFSDENFGVYEAPEYFPKIMSHAKCTPVKIEDIRVPREKLIKGAYPGARFDVFYPGFPTLKHLKYESRLRNAKVKVFEMASRNENMILKLLPCDLDPFKILGEIIWVGWPHLIEAKVVAVSDKKQRYVFSKDESQGYKVEPTQFDREIEGVTHHYRDRMGIEFGDTEFLVHVQLMSGRKYVFTSGRRVSLEKQFSRILAHYPLQSVVANIVAHDEYKSNFTDITDVFPEGSTCFSLTHPHYGSQGEILDSTETLKNNQLKVQLHVFEEPDFAAALQIDSDLKNSYMNLTNAASQLAISNYVFSRITGSLFVQTPNLEGCFKSVNIGLDLKFNKKNQETPGYTRKLGTTWFYTDKAVKLVRTYIERYPEVFEYLYNSNDDEIMADVIFQSGSEEKVKSIQVWLRTLPTHNIERRVCGSSVLEPEVVKKIEQLVDEKLQEASKDLVMQLKPQFLYKPEIQTGNLAPDPFARTEVFDRIVNVREGVTVPLGSKGTVIAVHKSSVVSNTDEMFDIVFDKPFAGGMVINCSEHKGYRLPKSSFINLTYGKRQMEQKTGVPGALRALAKERHNGNPFNPALPAGNFNLKQQNSAFASFNKVSPNLTPQYNKGFQQNYQPKTYQQRDSGFDQQRHKNTFQYMTDFSMGDPRINKENSAYRRNPANGQNRQQPAIGGASTASNSKPKTEVDTDFLKKILNIQNTHNTAKPNSGPPQRDIPREPPKPKPHHSPACPNATTRLLSFYQSNMLGCPIYTYLEEANGVRAQVALPNGKILFGKSAVSREEASENVAQDALNILQSPKSRSMKEGLPLQFPVPPTKWVQGPQSRNTLPSQVFVNKSYQMRPHQNTSMGDYSRREAEANFSGHASAQNFPKSRTNVANPNFIPLQALKKKQSNRAASNVNRNYSGTSQGTKIEKNDSASNVQTASYSKGYGASPKERNDKSGGPRKTRIAANFNK